jgi:hypothetical protein
MQHAEEMTIFGLTDEFDPIGTSDPSGTAAPSGNPDTPETPSGESEPSEEDKFFAVVDKCCFPLLASCSVRTYNVLVAVRDKCKTIRDFYLFLLNFSDKDVKNMRGCGQKTAEEIAWMSKELRQRSGYVEDPLSASRLASIGIPEAFQDSIRGLAGRLGHFPMFAAISAYIRGFDDDSRLVLENCLRFRKGQVVADRKVIARQLGVTPERVRQKRNNLIEDLSSYFTGLTAGGFITENPYPFIMTRMEEEVNSTEGTDFNANFVRWALSTAFEDVTMVGDIFKPLTNYFNDDYFVNIVPSALCGCFDFNAFVGTVDEKVAERRIDAETVSLRGFIRRFWKGPEEGRGEDVENACRSILFQTYPVDLDGDSVTFRPNARKNNPDVVEDILRAAGHPMTLEALLKEFRARCPERKVTKESFRASVNNCPAIVPVGRSSTYALGEWDGEETRGGTIRSIAIEYISSRPGAIAPFSDVVEYVTRYRPSTNEASIYDNFSLESSGAFKFFFLKGERYLGLGGREYPDEYFPLEPDSKSAMNMSVKFPQIIDFIESKGRFPLSSGVPVEEIRLYQFWAKQVRLFKSGTMTPHALLYYQRIQGCYGHLKAKKSELSGRLF